MAPVPIEERIEQLYEFESEHGHMLVPQSYKKGGLGRFVNTIRTNKNNGKVKPDVIEKLDAIGFMWTVPKGNAKEELIQWGKGFRWLVNFQKAKGHCNVPATIAGEPVPAAAWCEQQRKLHLNNQLDQGKVDRLSKLGFDFYGTCEPAPKRQRTDDAQRMRTDEDTELIKTLYQENQALREENKMLKESLALKADLEVSS